MSSFAPNGDMLWRYTGAWATGAQHGEGVEESYEGGVKTVRQGVWHESKYKKSADTP